MKSWSAFALCGLLFATPALADDLDTLLKSGPVTTATPLPDPTHVPIIFGKDIVWKDGNGMRQALLFGDPDKSGIYGVLIE